jgi:hypothetical protein
MKYFQKLSANPKNLKKIKKISNFFKNYTTILQNNLKNTPKVSKIPQKSQKYPKSLKNTPKVSKIPKKSLKNLKKSQKYKKSF